MIYRISLCLVISILLACSGGGDGSIKSLSLDGYKIVKHLDGDGKVGSPGDYVFFNFDSYDGNGEVWQSFKDAKVQPHVRLPKEGEQQRYLAFIELLKKVSKGDSLSMFLPYDSLQQAPQSMIGQLIEYRVGITDIMNNEEYTAYMNIEKERKNKELQEAKQFSEKKVAEAADLLSIYKKGEYTNTITTPSGLKVTLLEEGRGDTAAAGKNVSVDYVGLFKDGGRFDDSFMRGQPFSFQLGQGSVIKGWDEGLTYMNIGSKALLDIPYPLAYGEKGSPPNIPPKSDLIFIVELNAIN